jgi:ribokinase
MNKQGVLVIGSSNLDLVVTAKRFPKPGETIFGKKFNMFPGGKGANQAVCAARLGCKTTFIGKMGNDEFQEKLSSILIEAGVDINNLFIDEEEHTGTALITVDEGGQNQIIVISGSNMKLSPQDIIAKSDLFSNTAVVLTQLEIPIDTVVQSAKITRQNNAIFILNPAPAASLPESIFPLIDFITPNENELELLSGVTIKDDSSIKLAADKLLKKGIRNVIVTLGSRGSMLINQSSLKHFPANKVKVVDSTAAGDAFNGAFASSISEGHSIEEAIEFANKVASIAVTRMGAQSSMPYLSEINDLHIV